MPHIYLVRHGQASFGARNYDVLSERGERQATVLGEYLQSCNIGLDHIVHGGLERQRVTAKNMAAGLDSAPAIDINPAFCEYDATGLFKAYLPAAMQEDTEIRAAGTDIFKDRNLFERAFQRVTRGWLQDEKHALGEGKLERWNEFTNRVQTGLESLVETVDRKAHVAVVTSGGPISVACMLALGLSAEKTIALNWTTYNASVTELRWSPGRSPRLMGYNNISHLRATREAELITLR